jgi:hypothetical protein
MVNPGNISYIAASDSYGTAVAVGVGSGVAAVGVASGAWVASGTGVEVRVGVGVAAAVVVFALMSARAETCAGVGSGVGGTDDPPKQPRVIAVNPTTKLGSITKVVGPLTLKGEGTFALPIAMDCLSDINRILDAFTKLKGMYSGLLVIRISPFSDAISYERI